MSSLQIGLMGSGEFTRSAQPADEWLLECSAKQTGKVLVVPTASAPEGEEVFQNWIRMGTDHYRALGVEPLPVAIRSREDASNKQLVDLVSDAQLVFFSGGNPGHLVRTFRDTPFWNELVVAMNEGVAFGGCSAGAVFIGALAPDVTSSDADDIDRLKQIAWLPGLGFLPRFFIGAHWDRLDSYVPGLTTLIRSVHPPETVLVGIDEDTTLCGDGKSWEVVGDKTVLIAEIGQESIYRSGETLTLASR